MPARTPATARDPALLLAATANLLGIAALGLSVATYWRVEAMAPLPPPSSTGQASASSTPPLSGAPAAEPPQGGTATPGPAGADATGSPDDDSAPALGEGQLSAEAEALLAGLPQDPAPEVLGGTREENYDRHYWSSDEWNLHLFAEHIEELGGAYVGVGPDQAYLMIGWMDPELAWVVDYDPEIVALHRVYAALLLAAPTAGDFLRLWSRDSTDEVERLLRAATPDDAEFEHELRVYRRAQGRVKRRLDRLHARHLREGIESYLSDPAQYRRVVELVAAGRVRSQLVDLNGERGMRGIAAAAEALGLSVRVLYLSNAEQYQPYTEGFRANIAALPFDDRSVVLRTIASHDANQDYRYNLQSAIDFQERIPDPQIRRPYHFVDLRPLQGPDDVAFTITTIPAQQTRSQLAALDPRDPRPCASAPASMACIPGGAFYRGMDDGPPYARPGEAVWLETFYMDTHEVTYAQYRACEAAGDCPRARPRYADFNHPRQPMNGVSWYDADAYCRAAGKQLPTEAQWEKAARGTDGRMYPWGNEKATCEHAIIMEKGERSCGVAKRFGKPEVGRPFEVGSRPPNQYGLYDMAGNAYEWVADWFAINYEKCGDDCRGIDPQGPCGGEESCPKWPKKVVRGGSWYWPAHHASTVHRRAHSPENEPFHHFGFRCAATLEQASALHGSASDDSAVAGG